MDARFLAVILIAASAPTAIAQEAMPAVPRPVVKFQPIVPPSILDGIGDQDLPPKSDRPLAPGREEKGYRHQDPAPAVAPTPSRVIERRKPAGSGTTKFQGTVTPYPKP
jgi:hypothetical protein